MMQTVYKEVWNLQWTNSPSLLSLNHIVLLLIFLITSFFSLNFSHGCYLIFIALLFLPLLLQPLSLGTQFISIVCFLAANNVPRNESVIFL